MIAPIDRRRSFNSGLRKTTRRGEKIGMADAKRMVASAQRMPDDLRALGCGQRRSRNFEERKILPSAIQQDLIAEAGNHAEAEHVEVKTLGACEVAHLEAEMVELLQLHRPTIVA